MGRIFKVQSAEGGIAPADIEKALKLAEKDGILRIPADELALNVAGGAVETEDSNDER